jgi:hypothetical protein
MYKTAELKRIFQQWLRAWLATTYKAAACYRTAARRFIR